MLDGVARLVVDDRDLRLAVGDTAEFATWRPHWLGAVDQPAQVLILFAPDGTPPTAKLG